MSSLMADLRYALRTLRRTPSFTFIAAATAALGIAANVTVFSFVDALFLRELPVKHPDRLVRVFGKDRSSDDLFFSYPAYRYLRDHSQSLDQVVAHYSTAPLYISANGESAEVQGAVVTANYFPMLGVTPRLGRFFEPREDAVPGRDAVAVLGYGLWRNWFGGDPDVVGKSITINQKVFTVTGVAPADFPGVDVGFAPNQIWLPSAMLGAG